MNKNTQLHSGLNFINYYKWKFMSYAFLLIGLTFFIILIFDPPATNKELFSDAFKAFGLCFLWFALNPNKRILISPTKKN